MTYPSNDYQIETHRQENYGFDTAGGGGIGQHKKHNCPAQDEFNRQFQEMRNNLTQQQRDELDEYHKQWETKNRYRYDYYN